MRSLVANIAAVVAHDPGVVRAVRAKRDELHTTAKTIFAAHDRPDGHKITKSNGSTDAFVWLEGPAPHIVEYGRAGYTKKGGTKVGPMEGIAPLTKAADQA